MLIMRLMLRNRRTFMNLGIPVGQLLRLPGEEIR